MLRGFSQNQIHIAGYAAFKTLGVSGGFGGSDLKLGGKCFEHSVGSEFSLRVWCEIRVTRVLRVHVTSMTANVIDILK